MYKKWSGWLWALILRHSLLIAAQRNQKLDSVFLSALGNERMVAILSTRHIETDLREFCVYSSGSAMS